MDSNSIGGIPILLRFWREEIIRVQATTSDETKARRKRITFITGLLITLIGIRLIAGIVKFVLLPDPFYIIDIAIFLAAIIGISIKAKWGSLLIFVYSLISLILSLSYITDFFLSFDHRIWPIFMYYNNIIFDIGSAFMYILIAIIAWIEYSSLRKVRWQDQPPEAP